MTKPVQVLDRVTIRFAGDSGDGMRSPETVSPARPRRSATTCRRCPTSRPRSAPRRLHPGGVGVPAPLRRPRHPHPGDAPDVLVAMNPAVLKANLGDLPKGASLIVNTDSFTPATSTRPGYASNPLEDGTGRLPGPPGGADLHDPGGPAEYDISKKEAERAKNMFALGSCPGCTRAPPRPPSPSWSASSPPAP